MARVSYNKIINTNNFKYLILALIILLTFGTCHKCMTLFSIQEGNSAKSTDADGDTKSDSSGNSKKSEKYWETTKDGTKGCYQVKDNDAKTICNEKGCDGDASIEKACKKITCYKCKTNNKCHGDC